MNRSVRTGHPLFVVVMLVLLGASFAIQALIA